MTGFSLLFKIKWSSMLWLWHQFASPWCSLIKKCGWQTLSISILCTAFTYKRYLYQWICLEPQAPWRTWICHLGHPRKTSLLNGNTINFPSNGLYVCLPNSPSVLEMCRLFRVWIQFGNPPVVLKHRARPSRGEIWDVTSGRSDERHRLRGRKPPSLFFFFVCHPSESTAGSMRRCKVPQYPVASYDTDVVEFTSRGNHLPSPKCPIKKGAGMLKGQGATGVLQCSTRTPYITASWFIFPITTPSRCINIKF